MHLISSGEPHWTLHHPEWLAVVRRLRAGLQCGPVAADLLVPVVEHFESGWTHLGQLALVAEQFVAPTGHVPLPIQHLADFVIDDIVDVFRGAASEVLLLAESEERWTSEPSPDDVIEEGHRFQRLLVVAALAAKGTGADDLLSGTTKRVAEALDQWSVTLETLLTPVAVVLEATHNGAGDGFSSAPYPTKPN